MKLLTAYTTEIDDPRIAVEDILDQLDLEHNLCGKSLGILACYPEFVETGVCKAICDALPFEVVGGTALGCATDSQSGMMQLSLGVLTGDDVAFATAVTRPLEGGDLSGPIEEACERGRRQLGGKPAMIMALLPMIRSVGGELLFQEIAKAAGDIPVFGSVVSDPTGTEATLTMAEGACYSSQVVLVFVGGELDPGFYILSQSGEKLKKQTAIITKSKGNILMEVNGSPVTEYLDSLGFSRGGGIESLTAFPFMVDYQDGTPPLARAIHMMTPEGYAVCGAVMTEGATLSLNAIDKSDVLNTMEEIVRTAAATGKTGGMLLLPCLSRNMVLGSDAQAEMDRARAVAAEYNIPCFISYAGGEICPVPVDGKDLVNRFHNFTAIACVF